MEDLRGKRVAIMAKAKASEFDAVMLPGGVLNADAIRIEKKAQQIAQEIDLRCAGPNWEDKEYIRDRKRVSSRKPGDLPVFNREMIALLAEVRTRKSEKKDTREVRA